jgi:type I restriction enzyme S subunit
MSEASFPQEWVKCTIGDACALNPKEKLPDNLDVGFMPMAGVPTNHFGTCNFETRPWEKVKKGFTQFKNGDVIFAKITPCFENSKAAIIRDFPSGWGAGSTEYYVLRPYGDLVRPEILFALIKSKEFLVSGAVNMSGSVGHKRVPKDFVSGYELPLPPFAEQKVIADKLDTLLAQVENTKARLERIPKILKRFRQSVLAAAVSGRLTEEWRTEMGASQWIPVTLKEVSDIKDPQPSHRTPKRVENGIPYVGIGDLKSDGSIDFENARRVSSDVLSEHKKRYQIKSGDFIFGKIGTLGKATILPTGREYTLSANVILIQPKLEKVRPPFLMYFLSAPATLEEIARQSNSTSQAAFGIKKMREFVTSLPSRKEQTEIVRQVDLLLAHADRIEQQVNNALARVNNLTQSILAKAFRGELTEQWRKDNPELVSGENSAEALLERINDERGKQKPAVRRTKSKKSEQSAT